VLPPGEGAEDEIDRTRGENVFGGGIKAGGRKGRKNE